MSLHDRLRQVREHLGQTQASLAQRLEIGASTWQKYELGVSLPKAEALKQLAEEGISVDWLLTGEGEMMRDARRGPAPFDVGLPLPQQRGTAPLDTALLKLCVEQLENHLDRKRRQLSAAKRAEIISLLYEISVEEEGGLEEAKRYIPRMLRLVS